MSKDYEILECYHTDINFTHKYIPSKDSHGTGMTCEEMRCNIKSVKRLSDQQIFTIGDEVTYKPTQKFSWAIDNFIITEDGLLARSKGNSHCELINDDILKKHIDTIGEFNKKHSDKDDFVWNDELVYEYLREMVIGKLGFENNHMDKFKQSKSTPKEDRWIVNNIKSNAIGNLEISFNIISGVPEEKYEAIKLAIGFVLNGTEIYSIEDLEKAFNAAREMYPLFANPSGKEKRYPTFQEYLQSKNKQL